MNKTPIAAYFMVLFALLAACSLVENEENCDPFGLDYEGNQKQPSLYFSLRYEKEPNNFQPMIGYVYHFDSVWLYDENFKKIPDFFSEEPKKAPFFIKNYGGNNRFSFPERNALKNKELVSTYYLRLAYNDIDTFKIEYKLNNKCDLYDYATIYYNNNLIKTVNNEINLIFSITKNR